MTETELMNRIAEALSQRFKALVLRVNAGTFLGFGGNAVKGAPKGTADLIVCMPGGLFLACEVKTAHGRQTQEQKRFQNAVMLRGGAYILARSVKEAIELAEKAVNERTVT